MTETAKKTLATAAALSLGMVVPTGLAYADPGAANATITVNGQQVAPINGKISCSYQYTGFVIQAGHDRGSAYVKIGHAPSINSQPVSVDSTRITQTDGAEYDYDNTIAGIKGDVHYEGPSDPAAHSSGNYKITGNIQQHRSGGNNGGFMSDGPVVPFEIDATCP